MVSNVDKRYAELENLVKEEKLKGEIVPHLIKHWEHLNLRRYLGEEAAINFFIKDEKGKVDFVTKIEKEVFRLEGKHVLDIGCGKGGVVISCALRGAKAFGFDADEDEIKIAKLRAESHGIVNASVFKGDAEYIPFPDNFFDVATATSVLEHVKRCEKVIQEMVRVTKPGGSCCIICPNPLFPREGHYKVFYIPYLPKKLGKIYLRIRGFNPDFFAKSVTYPYPSISKIERTLRRSGLNARNITERDILAKFEEPTSIKTGWIKNIARCLKPLRVNKLIAKTIVGLHPYSGGFIIGTKGEGEPS